MQALDVFQLKQKQVAMVVHGNQLSRVDIKSGHVSPVAGSPSVGKADGTGANAQFNEPKDVAVFSDPKSPDTWMALVADSGNDQLRLVKDPLQTGQVSTVLEKAMVEAPRRVAVVESRQTTPDMLSTNHKRKIFAFLICGKNTVVRVENILGRRNITSEVKAYESDWERKLRDRDKEIYNENTRATVHLISSKFMHLSDIAVAKQHIDGGERIVLFVVDQKAGLLLRLDNVIEGERRARVVEIGDAGSHVGTFLSVQSGKSWFGISGGSIPEKEGEDVKKGGITQHIYRVDQVIEGSKEGVRSSLHSLKQDGRMVSIAAMANWGGKVYFIVDSLKGETSLFELDMSHPLICKDQTMMGSTEFNELGELENLGLVQVETKDVALRSWVGMAPLKSDKVDWRVVAFRADEGRVCGISTMMQDPSASVFGYHCSKGICAPS